MLTRISVRGEGQKNHLKGIGISSCNLDVGFELAGWGFSLFYISNTHTKKITFSLSYS